ncbi:MAG: hypothetical protein ACKOUS_01365 [Alphaproteobacteria bacterium]
MPSLPEPDHVPAFPSHWCYSLLAGIEAGVLPRVIGELARRGLVPLRLDAVRAPGGLGIDIEVDGLDAMQAAHVAERLRGLPEVERVLVSTRIFAEEARA